MKKVLVLVVLALIVLDQFTKWMAAKYLPFHESVEIVPFFSLYLTYNKGVAFSFLSGMGSHGLIVLTLIITAFMIYLWRKVPSDQQLASLGFALVISGALGNLIDRVTLGHVVDFFLIHTQTWAFAVFNVADSFITLGGIAIIAEELVMLFQKSKTRKIDE